MANNALARVEILMQQNRYREAEEVLRNLLSGDTNNITYLLLLGESHYQQDKFDEARHIASHITSLAPDEPEVFFLKSRIAAEDKLFDIAEEHIKQAINLEPYDADYFAFYGQIQLIRKKYSEALNLADEALQIDPENIGALNIRSAALIKLNREEESFETIEGALRNDPNNAYTHANYGWGLLEKGSTKKALKHFEESLKTDPNHDYAQAGMLEAIKAKSFFYRLFLKYAFFMNKLTANYRWAVIIGLYVATRVLVVLARNNESFRPFLIPAIIVLSLFAFSTWVITPLSNLFLRLNRYGKFLLSSKEKLSSNFVAASCLIMLLGIITYFIFRDTKFLAPAAFGFLMMVPLGVMFEDTKSPKSLLYYTIALAAVGAAGVITAFTSGTILNGFLILFGLGFFAFQWVANYQLIDADE